MALQSKTSEVVVVGGGLMGCLSAWRLAQRGVRVTVLERSVPGAEASSAAAGILAAQCEAHEDNVLFSLGLESRELYASLSDELHALLGISVGYRRCGTLESFQDAASLEARWAQCDWQRERGLRAERLDRGALLGREKALGEDIAGAVYFADDGRVEPAVLVSAVAQAAERAGVRFRTGTLVRGLLRHGGRVTGVELEDGALECEAVVLAAGAWSSLVGSVGLNPGAVKPARGQLVELGLRTAPLASVLYGEGGYVVPRDDGRVVAGSTLEFVGFRNEVTAAGLQRLLTMATSLVPSLGDARVLRHWASFRPWTPDGAPLVGEAPEGGLFVATGHYRSGILLAPVTAQLVCEALVDGVRRPGLGTLAPDRRLA